MTALVDRLQTADHRLLERALCHLAGMHANLLFPGVPEGERQASARMLVDVVLDVAGRDVCLPFDLNPAKATDSPVCKFSDRTCRGQHQANKRANNQRNSTPSAAE